MCDVQFSITRLPKIHGRHLWKLTDFARQLPNTVSKSRLSSTIMHPTRSAMKCVPTPFDPTPRRKHGTKPQPFSKNAFKVPRTYLKIVDSMDVLKYKYVHAATA